MKISYNEACSLHCSTLEKDLILAEKNKFDFIEIRLDQLKEYMKTHSIDELVNFFASSTIKPHAFNALYTYDSLFSENDDLSKRKELLEEFEYGLNIAQKIGAGYFIIVPPLQRDPNGGPYIGNDENTFHNCVRILTNLSSIASNYNIKLCFEIVGFDRSSVRTIKLAKKIIDAVNLPNVGYVVDSYNLHLYEGLNDFSELKTLEVEKIFAAHLMNGEDVEPQFRGQDKRLFCGEGVVDTQNFLKNLHEMGYKGMVSVETFRPEYWEKDPEWVIEQAYKSTYNEVKLYLE